MNSSASNSYKGYVDLGSSTLRLDVYVADHLQLFTRSQIKARALEAKVNGLSAKLNKALKSGDLLELVWQANQSHFIKEDLPLEIIFENDDVWVINKAQGMAVHPGAGRKSGTLANALAYRLGQSNQNNQFSNSERAGIVHRLDMETSGVIICAKHEEAHQFLAAQFKNRSTKKRYMAIVESHIQPITGLVDNYIDRSRRNRKLFTCGDDQTRGRRAMTGYRVLESFAGRDLVLFKPYTGRTHQLRVHANYLGHPIVGDSLYNSKYSSGNGLEHKTSLMLHAWKLQIVLPNESEARVFMASVPQRFYEHLGLV